MAINQDNFVFHTSLVPISIPATHSGSMTTSTSLEMYEKKITYNSWVSLPSADMAPEAYFIKTTSQGNVFKYKDYLHETEYANVYTILIQQETGRFRMVLVEENVDSEYHTLTPRTIQYTVNFVHMAQPQQ